MRVAVYTKPQCPECDELVVALARLAPLYGLQLKGVNVESDSSLRQAYGSRVPVVEIEDGALGRLEAPITEDALELALVEARYRTGGGGVARTPARSTLDRATGYIAFHWLRFATIAMGIYVGLPWLAPVFAALGWWSLADPIYTAYAFT